MKINFITGLCLSIALCFMLLEDSFAQETSVQSVEVSGYSFNNNTTFPNIMMPVDYGVVVSKRFLDSNNLTKWLDPSGDTVLRSLQVIHGIMFEDDQDRWNLLTGTNQPFVLRNAANTYFIHFDDTDGDARFFYLRATDFHMKDPGPLGWNAKRGGGKWVYDIAEAVLTAADAQPGDVVVISSTEDITLVRSKKKFDLSVAGVISTDPKIYMGYSPEAKKEGKYKPLALAGIVLCKVSAENGAIKKGDILVTASLPGHAMRADPGQLTPGMMLGSALGNWDKGEGKIYILIN